MRHSLIYLHSQDRLPLPFSSHPQPRSLGGFRGGGWEAQADCVGIRLLPRPLRVTAGPPGAEGVPERPHPTPGIPLVPKMPLPLGTPSPQTRWCHPRVGWKQAESGGMVAPGFVQTRLLTASPLCAPARGRPLVLSFPTCRVAIE